MTVGGGSQTRPSERTNNTSIPHNTTATLDTSSKGENTKNKTWKTCKCGAK